jgi:hypothetical protein
MLAITRAEVVEEILERVRDEHPLPQVDGSQTVDTASGGNKDRLPRPRRTGSPERAGMDPARTRCRHASDPAPDHQDSRYISLIVRQEVIF